MRALALLLLVAGPALADPRVCYVDVAQVPRYADGTIKRSTAAKAAFTRQWPCPANGEVSASCPGWAIDHVIPLAAGGCDQPVNMQWLPLEIKSCAGTVCKDRWERRVYAPRSMQ